jgi:hypothetical protein
MSDGLRSEAKGNHTAPNPSRVVSRCGLPAALHGIRSFDAVPVIGCLMLYFTHAEGGGPITSKWLKPLTLAFILLSLAQNAVITSMTIH